MFTAGLNCKACHIFHESEFGISGKTFATGESCEKCHGKGYARLYQQWEDNMEEKLSLVKLGLDEIDSQIIKNNKNTKYKGKTSALLKDAQYNYQLVRTGNVVHNVAYSDQLLLDAYNNLQEILLMTEADLTLPSLELYNTAKPSKCQNCHYGQESKKVEVFDINFDHATHIQNDNLSCLSCHSHQNTHGETIITRDACLSCHHSQGETDCVKCHQIQTHLYDGTLEISDVILPDIMYDSGVECKDCHEDEDMIISKEFAQNCNNCHDEEYDSLMQEWQDETGLKIVEIKNSLSNFVYYDLDKVSRQKIDSIKYGIEKIERDNSLGVHNIEMTTRLLDKYKKLISEILN